MTTTTNMRFTITKSTTDDLQLINTEAGAKSSASKGGSQLIGSNGASGHDPEQSMALYEDDLLPEQPLVSRIINQLANYEGFAMPARDLPSADGQGKAKQQQKLGTVLGVFFPCVQNIFGIILFVRMVWLVGTAGILQGFTVVFLCCLSTFVTSISLSAVATNGVVKKGGAYFMVSRTLGPEFGGAVGILFYLGNSVAASMYIVGAVELLLNYMLPVAAIFKPMDELHNAYNNFRVYGTCILIVLFLCVFVGVRFVSKFAPVALFAVLVSILCVYIGVFLTGPTHGPQICLLGDRLLSKKSTVDELGEVRCDKNETGPIFRNYCGNVSLSAAGNSTDPYCHYFMSHDTRLIPGIPGLLSGKFKENLWSAYNSEGDLIGDTLPGDKDRGEIVSDMTTSFIILIGIFFPSVTGIMAGSNRSADLTDPQKSIPVGTIVATSLTSLVYMSCFVLFGCVAEGQLLRDKFGESIGGGLIVAQFAWPSQWVILIGAFLATLGAGLQSLTSAPRLLHAVASDEIVPFLRFFSVASSNGEPRRALILTACITECGILLGNLDLIAPIITMFLLMCYTFVNVATLLQTLMKAPSWRPRFHFYHWTISLFGMILCLSIMFISGWYYAIAALVLALGIYKYIEYEGAKKEWGDGMRGLAMSAARYSLLRLQEGQPHVKNWRPQVLILLKSNDALQTEHPRMLSLARQLKTGKGLTLVASVLQGSYPDRVVDVKLTQEMLHSVMKAEKVKGFADVIVAKNLNEGLVHAVQMAGVGGLRHNTVMVGWPTKRQSQDAQQQKAFSELLRTITTAHHALLMVKNVDAFPGDDARMTGVIDIWWIISDGGILVMLAFLLTHHKVWRACSIRLFSVAQGGDNTLQIEKDLKQFMYQLRINAEVVVVELPDNDISAYTYEKTLMLEQRNAMLKNIRRRDSRAAPDEIMDMARQSSLVEYSSKGKLEPVREVSDPPPYPDGASVPAAAAAGPASEEAAATLLPDATTSTEVKVDNKTCAEKKSSTRFLLTPSTLEASKGNAKETECHTSNDRCMARMETAIRLNQTILPLSSAAQLVIMNLPCPPRQTLSEDNYMDFLEVLTEGLNRVLMVRGSGREYVTIYS